FLDGVAFPGGKGEKYELTLGSGQFIPGFEEQVVGHKPGDEFDINVTFPEEYGAEELAGKAVVFKIKIHELKKKELPAVDDEFAKDVSEFDTLDELKKSIIDRLTKNNEDMAEHEVEDAIVDTMTETLEGDIPEVMIEERIDEMIRDFEYRLQSQGMNVKTYLQYTGMKGEDFRKTFKEPAEKFVKTRLALESIVRAEKIEIAAEDIEKEYQRLADVYKMEVEKIKAFVPEKEMIKDLSVNKAIDFVKENAKITVEKVTKAAKNAEKKPAKKAAAKKETAKSEE
ncbi:MAG: trigger factor, partial [Ruminococcaceae bacterium]|nr:trigger factor [Oscillospiraceae bacterium]